MNCVHYLLLVDDSEAVASHLPRGDAKDERASELPVSGIFSESIISSITWVIVFSVKLAYKRSLFNLLSDVLTLMYLSFILFPQRFLMMLA
jgi:hypothetical protein